MAEPNDDLLVVGFQRAVVLFKPPATIPPADAPLLTVIDRIGPHTNGFVLALVRVSKIPLLRAAGAEVIVVDPDANNYSATTRDATDEDVVALLDKRVDEHNSELAIAQAGKDRNKPDDGDDGGGSDAGGSATS